jgi:Flp pilus assembly protein TadB
MNKIKDIKDIWESQDDYKVDAVPLSLQKRIRKSNKLISNKHIITILILSLTALVIAFGFVYLIDIKSKTSNAGLFIMELVLFVRIVIEVYSYRRKLALDETELTSVFKQKLISFYNWRKGIHGFKTLLLVIVYISGVALLFVEFKGALSNFWFNFFVVEFLVMAILLIWFIRKQVRKEIKELNDIIEILSID